MYLYNTVLAKKQSSSIFFVTVDFHTNVLFIDKPLTFTARGIHVEHTCVHTTIQCTNVNKSQKRDFNYIMNKNIFLRGSEYLNSRRRLPPRFPCCLECYASSASRVYLGGFRMLC